MALPAPAPDETLLITGASSGIGAELARQLAGRGHNVVLVARRQERLDQLAEELRLAHGIAAEVHACDLADDAARAALIEVVQSGERHVAGVCNNAGYGSFGLFWEHELEREVEMVRLNVVALHELTGAFLPAMLERGAGAILNVGSTAAFQPLPGNATYAATKAFVLSFSEALNAELSGTGVSCTCLCPGPVKTEFTEVADVAHTESQLPDFAWLSAADVAHAAIEGMVKGKRSVVPGVSNKATALAGRFVPRSALLPAVRAINERVTRGRDN